MIISQIRDAEISRQLIENYSEIHENCVIQSLPSNSVVPRDYVSSAQRTVSSCGESVGEFSVMMQGLHRNLLEIQEALPVAWEGIYHKELVTGFKDLGIECVEHTNANVDDLVKGLKKRDSIFILGILAPWCALDEILTFEAEHYIALTDYNEGWLEGVDSGWHDGRIGISHDNLPLLWRDRDVGNIECVGWMLQVLVKIKNQC
jgi:hypothetical protein